jgi:predicted DNA-binding transcriptional regulator AlpA
MTEFEFELVYRLGPEEADVDQAIERLGEAGCTDSNIAIGVAGEMALHFYRDGEDAQSAIRSAMTDIRRAMPTATLIEASPDLVGLTEVADLVGVSRQNMRKLMLANESFPPAVHRGSTSIWHLADVLAWLQDKGSYAIEQTVLELAKATQQINALRESMRVQPAFAKKFARLLA